MNKFERNVREFHEAMDLPAKRRLDRNPRFADLKLRYRLIEEEFKEVKAAFIDKDVEQLSAELVDLIYVCVGAAITFGIPLSKVWDAIHAANMAKVGGPIRSDGKRLKPEGWEPADIKGVLKDA